MTTFNLDIVFTGICSLVLDKPIGTASQLWVAIPDSWDTKRKTDHKGMDEKVELVRHGASVQIPSANLSVAQGFEGGTFVWYPKRHRLTFDFDQNNSGANPFTIDQSVGAHVANMAVIADKFKVKKEVIGKNPGKEILANIEFPQKRGELLAVKGSFDWRFSGILSGATQDILYKEMAFKVILRMKGIKKATMTATRLDGPNTPRPGNPGSPKEVALEIVGKEGENVKITIANLCDVNPLDWEARDSVVSKEDLDFKWHYECLYPQKDEVKRTLNGQALPYPKKDDRRGGSGRNCFPALWVAEL